MSNLGFPTPFFPSISAAILFALSSLNCLAGSEAELKAKIQRLEQARAAAKAELEEAEITQQETGASGPADIELLDGRLKVGGAVRVNPPSATMGIAAAEPPPAPGRTPATSPWIPSASTWITPTVRYWVSWIRRQQRQGGTADAGGGDVGAGEGVLDPRVGDSVTPHRG